MSEIYLDERKIDLPDYQNDWALLLKEVYDIIGKNKRGIMKIEADGEDITQIVSGAKPGKTPDDYNKIIVNTLDISQIAFNGIENVKKFLPSLIKILKGAAEFARLGEEDKKNEAINGSLEGIKLIITLFINIHNLYKFDINAMKLDDGTTVASKFTNLNKIFEIFNNAQQRRDNVEIADIIEYELLPEIENFDQVFNKIKGEIKDNIVM